MFLWKGDFMLITRKHSQMDIYSLIHVWKISSFICSTHMYIWVSKDLLFLKKITTGLSRGTVFGTMLQCTSAKLRWHLYAWHISLPLGKKLWPSMAENWKCNALLKRTPLNQLTTKTYSFENCTALSILSPRKLFAFQTDSSKNNHQHK